MTSINQMIEGLQTGHCIRVYNQMPSNAKQNTMIKTAAAALLSGIFTGVVLGSFLAVVVAAIVGIGAFAYVTTSYSSTDFLGDTVRNVVDSNLSREQANNYVNRAEKGVNQAKTVLNNNFGFNFRRN
jgi:hypothetical protein